MRAYAQRLGPLQSQETRMRITEAINAALATNTRSMSDEDRSRFLRDLNSPPKAVEAHVQSPQIAHGMGSFLPTVSRDASDTSSATSAPSALSEFLRAAHISVEGGET